MPGIFRVMWEGKGRLHILSYVVRSKFTSAPLLDTHPSYQQKKAPFNIPGSHSHFFLGGVWSVLSKSGASGGNSGLPVRHHYALNILVDSSYCWLVLSLKLNTIRRKALHTGNTWIPTFAKDPCPLCINPLKIHYTEGIL